MLRRFTVVVLVVTISALVACRRKPDPAAHIAKADQLVSEGKFAEAIIEFRIALQADPKRGDARLKLADTYVRAQDLKSALPEYGRAADLLPQSLEAQLKAGHMLLLAQAFEDAKSRADRALELDPKNVEAQVLRAHTLIGLKDLRGALDELQEAVVIDPSLEGPYMSLGTLQAHQGQRDEAEATFRKAVAAAPKSTSAHLALANFLWMTGRASESEETLKTVLQIDPHSQSANEALGTFYVTTGRAAEAEKYFIASAQGGTNIARSLTLADYYLVQKRFDAARKTLAEVAQRPDGYAPASVRLAAIDILEGKRAEAKQRLHDVLTKELNYVPALMWNARLLFGDGKHDEALAITRTVLASNPPRAFAAQSHLLAGQIHMAAERYADAIAEFEKALPLDPRPIEANTALAQLSLRQGDAKKATDYARQALTLQPSNSTAHALLVRSEIAAGDLAAAKKDLDPLQKQFSRSAAVSNLAALMEIADNHPDKARAQYEKALRLDANNDEALAGLVHLDFSSGHAKDAIARVEARLKGSKPSAGFLVLAAKAYGEAKDTSRAEAVLLQAIELEPTRIQARDLLGELYLGQKRWEETKDQYREILKLDPKSSTANTVLAMVLERQGNTSEAEKEYERALLINPRAAIAANNLASIWIASNRKLDEALQLAQAAYRERPQDPAISDTLGWAYFRKNLVKEAIPHLEASVQKAPNDALFQFHLGMAYVQAGAWANGRRALKAALSLSPNFAGVEEARKALEMIGASG